MAIKNYTQIDKIGEDGAGENTAPEEAPLPSAEPLLAQNPDEQDETQLDAAAAINSAFYDAPISGPDWFIAKVQMAAAFANRLAGTANWTIGNGPGSLSNKTQQEIADDKAEEDAEFFDTMMDMVEERQAQEREEWARSTHSYAGVEMTGEEWGGLSDQLSTDSPLRKWLLEQIMSKGKTKAEAEKAADQVALLARMQSLPKDQWTDEMKNLVDRI